MKKLNILVIMLTIISLPLAAQKKKDALYLRNGSVIYGKLLEISDNHYKIQSSDGSLFIYPISDVEKFVKEVPYVTGRKSEGSGIALEAGLLIGSQVSQYPAPFSFNVMVNYTLNTRNIFSGGSGVEFLGAPYTPLFAEYKYLLKEARVCPFVFVRAGGILHLGSDDIDSNNGEYDKKNFKGGPSITIGTGISWAKEDVEPYLSFAYRHTSTSYVQKTWNNNDYYDYTYKDKYNRLEFKFGFKF